MTIPLFIILQVGCLRICIHLVTAYYVSLYIACSHHSYVLPNYIDGYSRLAYQGVSDAIEQEIKRLGNELSKYPNNFTGNQKRWIRHRQNDMQKHITFYKERIVFAVNKLCEEHCHASLLSLIEKKRGVPKVRYGDITDLTEVFDVYDEALVATFNKEGDSVTRYPVDEVTVKLEQQYQQLKAAVEKSVLPSQPVTKDWVLKRKQDLLSRFASLTTLSNAVVELQQAFTTQISACTALEASLNNHPEATSSSTSSGNDTPAPVPVQVSHSNPQVVKQRKHHIKRISSICLVSNRS